MVQFTGIFSYFQCVPSAHHRHGHHVIRVIAASVSRGEFQDKQGSRSTANIGGQFCRLVGPQGLATYESTCHYSTNIAMLHVGGAPGKVKLLEKTSSHSINSILESKCCRAVERAIILARTHSHSCCAVRGTLHTRNERESQTYLPKIPAA